MYTTDYPDRKTARRQGIRMSRSIVLPPYLSDNAFFKDWLDCMDKLFETTVDDKIDILKNIRNMWVTNPELEQKIVNNEMVLQSDWSVPEQSIVLRQLNMLGLQLTSPTVMFNEVSFMNLCRFLGFYWMQKGTQTFIDFVNFCTGTQFVIRNCWTKDYVDFVPEGSDEIGTPIWEGGQWYPTTHVIFESINPDFTDVRMLGQLFYEIANYNLVLHSINAVYNLPIVNGDNGTTSIRFGLNYHNEFNIGTLGYGKPASTFGFGNQLLDNFDVSHFYSSMGDDDSLQDLEDQEALKTCIKILEYIRSCLYQLGKH